MLLFFYPSVCAAGDDEPVLIISPFVEYQYHTDKGGAEDVLDNINDLVGGWLRGYKDVELFEHLCLIGAEVRLMRPELPKGLHLFGSLAGTTGSTDMLNDDYDKQYELNSFPAIPGVVDVADFPFVDLDGDMRIRVDQYLDYYIPVQVGIRYEPKPDKTLSWFGSLSGGVLFYKGGMDIDVDMSGTARVLLINGQTSASYRGKVEVKDIGWIMSALVGMRYHWKKNLTSSVAVGFETGRLSDNADIDGKFSGNVRIDSSIFDFDTPFSMDIDSSESVDLRTDGWRVRVGIIEWAW